MSAGLQYTSLSDGLTVYRKVDQNSISKLSLVLAKAYHS